MKNIWLFILFFSLLMVGSNSITGVLPEAEVADCVFTDFSESDTQSDRTDMGVILPIDSSSPWESVVFTEIDLMGSQFGAHNRLQRLMNSSYSWLSKAYIRRIAVMRMALLTHSTVHIFSSLPFQSWSVSSEHYIFGMRRILI